LMEASRCGHLDIVRTLLYHDARVDSRNNDGWTPSMLASRCEHPNIVRMLLDHGAIVDSHDNDGWTPSGGKSLYLS